MDLTPIVVAARGNRGTRMFLVGGPIDLIARGETLYRAEMLLTGGPRIPGEAWAEALVVKAARLFGGLLLRLLAPAPPPPIRVERAVPREERR